ncbi:GGDEF domain-containing protein [Pseudoalteromonas arctica]|uniref:diguanylate cyclase n=1 Tax=Pseudoalteromonas arctica TaxID=394751 RepID=A0AAP6Y3B9_9GAMM|nr:GGDEF domain-containing protein [Pseudoalteromonas arctica]
MKFETVSLKLTRFVNITRLNKLLMLALLSFIVIFTIYNLVTFSHLDIKNNMYGFTSDLINLIVIVTVFWVVQCSKLAKKAYVYVTIGLLLWIVGMTTDLLNEVVVQPEWIDIYLNDLCKTLGMVITAYGLFKTMLFMQKMHNRLAQEFVIDELTKVYNRRCFYQNVKNAVTNSYTILIIDIDHFKSINDNFGHDMGDQVLKEFAGKVNALFENENIFARIGGEEFAGYFPSSNIDDVAKFSQAVLELVRTIKVKDDRFLTVSIGIAKRISDEALDKVMKRADQALYLAKKSGRDRFEIAP